MYIVSNLFIPVLKDITLASRFPRLLVTLLYIKSSLLNFSRLGITNRPGNLFRYRV